MRTEGIYMIRKETYTQNNINPDICDGVILYAGREPLEAEHKYGGRITWNRLLQEKYLPFF